jgi:hypothetical protein
VWDVEHSIWREYMKITIDQAIEQVTFPAPGKRVVNVEIHYTTGSGYKGTVVLEKSQATSAGIAAAIRADVGDLEKTIGTTIDLK